MLQWFDYVAVYIFANFIASHIQLMFVPGAFFIGLIGTMAFFQMFEFYASWRAKWK
jgi:hypothetical protein|tara:strand:+ start:128 stop:295 length:168 start_codon:yes stop_codon:yes gene_type:complete